MRIVWKDLGRVAYFFLAHDTQYSIPIDMIVRLRDDRPRLDPGLAEQLAKRYNTISAFITVLRQSGTNLKALQAKC